MPLPPGSSEDQRANGDGGPVFARSELAAAAGRDFLIKENADLLQSVFNKYEEWIFRSRTGLIIGVGALMSQLGTKNEAAAAEIALILPNWAGVAETKAHPLGALVPTSSVSYAIRAFSTTYR